MPPPPVDDTPPPPAAAPVEQPRPARAGILICFFLKKTDLSIYSFFFVNFI